MNRFPVVAAMVLGAVATAWFITGRNNTTSAADTAKPPEDVQKQIADLQQQVKRLEGLVPDQAAVMTKVAYHFTNFYGALQHSNWPLADFYLGETINNIKWAVRVRPVRKDFNDQDVDLVAIAQSIENTQFADMKKAIAARDKTKCIKIYEETLNACYGCHSASNKPFLKPQKPVASEVKIINFDPEASGQK